MENEKPILRGELALMAAIVINSFSVVLMLYSGSGISAISSVPYAFSEVFKELSLGTWTYIFQGALVLSLMILRRKFVPSYLFSFVAGFAFSELLDVNELWIGILPQTISCRIAYFLISYFLLSIGIALENRNIAEGVHLEALMTGGGKRQVPYLQIVDVSGQNHWMYESMDIIHYLQQQFAD